MGAWTCLLSVGLVFGCLDLSYGCLDLSSWCLDLSFGCLHLSFGCLNLSFVCLDLSFGCLDLSFGCLDLSFACGHLLVVAAVYMEPDNLFEIWLLANPHWNIRSFKLLRLKSCCTFGHASIKIPQIVRLWLLTSQNGQPTLLR